MAGDAVEVHEPPVSTERRGDDRDERAGVLGEHSVVARFRRRSQTDLRFDRRFSRSTDDPVLELFGRALRARLGEGPALAGRGNVSPAGGGEAPDIVAVTVGLLLSHRSCHQVGDTFVPLGTGGGGHLGMLLQVRSGRSARQEVGFADDCGEGVGVGAHTRDVGGAQCPAQACSSPEPGAVACRRMADHLRQQGVVVGRHHRSCLEAGVHPHALDVEGVQGARGGDPSGGRVLGDDPHLYRVAPRLEVLL